MRASGFAARTADEKPWKKTALLYNGSKERQPGILSACDPARRAMRRKHAPDISLCFAGCAADGDEHAMDIENTVVVKLKKVSNLLDRFMAEVKSDIERKVSDVKKISSIQGRIILYLHSEGKKGEALQKDIETYFDIRSSTAAIILGRMEKNGLITREISAEDVRKKRKSVHLTHKARKMYPLALAEIEDAEQRVVKGLTGKEIETLDRILAKITKNLT